MVHQSLYCVLRPDILKRVDCFFESVEEVLDDDLVVASIGHQVFFACISDALDLL